MGVLLFGQRIVSRTTIRLTRRGITATSTAHVTSVGRQVVISSLGE
ncbi:hypothetical protein A2U01_0051187, partial [Trifolium medium]|nr:hypothetical protein [Trifolium medium]